MPVAKEQIRQIIANNNLNSVTDVYTFLRDGFKDILQELMGAELDAALGYEKTRREMQGQQTNVMAIPPRTSRASMVNSRSVCPGTGMGNSSQSLSQNTRGISPGSRRKSSPSMPGA